MEAFFADGVVPCTRYFAGWAASWQPFPSWAWADGRVGEVRFGTAADAGGVGDSGCGAVVGEEGLGGGVVVVVVGDGEVVDAGIGGSGAGLGDGDGSPVGF
jgi:hypothetical protein